MFRHGTFYRIKAVTAIIALGAVCTFLISCSSETSNKTGETNEQVSGTVAETTAETEAPAPEIKDFSGYDFRICLDKTDTSYLYTDIETGDRLNDAIYARNIKIEETYNITISQFEQINAVKAYRENVMAGDDFADIVLIPMRDYYRGGIMPECVDLNTVGTLRLGMSWWDQGLIESTTVDGKLYCILGDVTAHYIRALGLLYNKTLYEDRFTDNLYDIVSGGTWTVDTFLNYVKGVSKDLNGDSVMDENDLWGFTPDTGFMFDYFTGSGERAIVDSGDGLEFALDEPRAHDVFAKALTIFQNTDSVKVAENFKGSYQTRTKLFINDQTLFTNYVLLNAYTELRGMESDYGILPYPKYDETQDRYYTAMQINIPAISIPNTAQDTERIGLILEALCYESHSSLRSVLYNVVLDEKVARDEESTAILDIMFANTAYEFDHIANISGIDSIFVKAMTDGNDNFVSGWAAIKEKANTKLADFVESFNSAE